MVDYIKHITTKKVMLDGEQLKIKLYDNQSKILRMFICKIYKTEFVISRKVYEHEVPTIYPDYLQIINTALCKYGLEKEKNKENMDMLNKVLR